MRASRPTPTEMWIVVGTLALLLINELFSSSPRPDPHRHRGQSLQLTEEHLQRLEEGQSVSLKRWHGHELVVHGSLSIDGEVDGESDDEIDIERG